MTNDDRDPNVTAGGAAAHAGPGPFVTRVTYMRKDGRRVTATSRRARKRLSALVATGEPDLHKATTAAAWRHLWLPGRIGWWVGVLFSIGSAHFVAGGLLATWPGGLAAPVSGSVLSWVFFVGSLFFTSAAYLQVVEVANADVAALHAPRNHRSWFGWLPHNLGWLASVTQLIGTVMFNFTTADAMISDLAWRMEDVVVWTPNIIACVLFLVASGLAWVEYSHGWGSFAPRSVSWWIVVLNVAGSAAFFVSGIFAYVSSGPPDPEKSWLDGIFTFLGAVCFLLGSLLLLPEQADE